MMHSNVVPLIAPECYSDSFRVFFVPFKFVKGIWKVKFLFDEPIRCNYSDLVTVTVGETYWNRIINENSSELVKQKLTKYKLHLHISRIDGTWTSITTVLSTTTSIYSQTVGPRGKK